MTNNKLEAMQEDDPFLEHLESLKEHPGWLAYQAWVQRQIDTYLREIERPDTNMKRYYHLRGCLTAQRGDKKALEILISEHRDKLKEVRK